MGRNTESSQTIFLIAILWFVVLREPLWYDVKCNLIKKLCLGIDEVINWFQTEFYKYDRKNRRILV